MIEVNIWFYCIYVIFAAIGAGAVSKWIFDLMLKFVKLGQDASSEKAE